MRQGMGKGRSADRGGKWRRQGISAGMAEGKSG